jgi:hypothetical protein
MPIDIIHRTVRDTFRETLKRSRQQIAFEASVRLLKSHRPDWMDVDIRKAVARMLAEEPLH